MVKTRSRTSKISPLKRKASEPSFQDHGRGSKKPKASDATFSGAKATNSEGDEAERVPGQEDKMTKDETVEAQKKGNDGETDDEDLRGKLIQPAAPQKAFRLTAPMPARDPKTREFRFAESEPAKRLDFFPNFSPEEVLRAGAYGGRYFRPIKSKKIAKSYKDDWKELPESWTKGLDVDKYLLQPEYDISICKWKAKVGQTYEVWEDNGWIRYEHDVRGWFHWYCRFFMGRRCADDERQIGRWKGFAGPTGRWRTIFLNKYLRQNVSSISPDKETISPAIRQTLLHWGFDATTAYLEMHAKKSGIKVESAKPSGHKGGKAKEHGRGNRGEAEDSGWDTEKEGWPEGEEEKVDDRGPTER